MRKTAEIFLVLAACGALALLGIWQLQRLQWKLDLIARINTQLNVDPTQVSLQEQLDSADNNLNRGFLQGRFLQNNDVHVGPHSDHGQLGYWVVSPLKLFGGRIVLVNRGWLPDAAGVPAPPRAVIKVMGTLRDSDGTAQPIAGNPHSWHRLDITGIAKALNLKDAAPMALFMEAAQPKDDGELVPAPALSALRNEHLNYAIFWFTMAGVLFFGYLAFSLRGKRSA